MPRAAIVPANCGSSMAAFAASCRYFTTCGGVFFGAIRRYHTPLATSQPSSLAVGTSGNTGWRCGWNATRTRMRLPSTCPLSSPGCATSASMWPEQRRARLAPARVRNVDHLDAGAVHQLLEVEVARGALARRADTDLAGVRSRVGDQFLDGLIGRLAAHRDHRIVRDQVDERLVIVGRLVSEIGDVRG